MSTLPIVVSALALAVSLGSLAVSLYVALRDRPRLKVSSQFFEAWEYGPDKIHVTLVNLGRRPVILRLIGGLDGNGNSGGTYLEHAKGGLRLGEHERHEFDIAKDDTMQFNPDGPDVTYERMWVEDSLGNRHAIPNSRRLIEKLWSTEAS
jgi:hypothetical protein